MLFSQRKIETKIFNVHSLTYSRHKMAECGTSIQLILLPIKTVGGKIYYIWIVELDHLGLLSKSGTADHIIFLSVWEPDG